MSIQELDRLGIVYTRDYIIPKDGKGQALRDDKGAAVKEDTIVNTVVLPLSSVEWCHIAMREGAHYVGGCCAHTSAMQDIVNTAFRDGGWIDAGELRHLAELAEHHEGFEEFSPEVYANVLDIDELDNPWEKIATVWFAAKDVLSVGSLSRPGAQDITDFDNAVSLVSRASWHLRMAKFFTDERDADSMQAGQRHANNTYNMLKLLPALRTMYDHLERMSDQEFHGFGIRAKGTDEVVVNGYGPCLYMKREQAEELFKVWQNAGDKEVDGWEILPVVVTVDEGLKWIE